MYLGISEQESFLGDLIFWWGYGGEKDKSVNIYICSAIF